jgi:hypothetical protein
VTRHEEHAPATQAVAELEQLRSNARLILRLYLPTPGRAALLRENALAQMRVRARLLAHFDATAGGPLAARPRFGGVGSRAPGRHLAW